MKERGEKDELVTRGDKKQENEREARKGDRKPGETRNKGRNKGPKNKNKKQGESKGSGLLSLHPNTSPYDSFLILSFLILCSDTR